MCLQNHILLHHYIVIADLSVILFMTASAVLHRFRVAFSFELGTVKLLFERVDDDLLVQDCFSETLKVAVYDVILFDQRCLLGEHLFVHLFIDVFPFRLSFEEGVLF